MGRIHGCKRKNIFSPTPDAPWAVVKSNCKKRARLNDVRYILNKIPCSNKDFK